MKLIKSVKAMQEISRKLHRSGKTIGFVPTMGYLHKGHLSLVRQSCRECDVTVMSIYVNPLQFGPKEDFEKYPRDIKRDSALAESAGTDYLFVPEHKDIYPHPYLTSIEVEKLSNILCGASRPGHFKGVATVVCKLFNIVMPEKAYFGQKDAQQAVIIEKMTKDLNFPVIIRVMPIIREHDGLAMSSRNAYLDHALRQDALVLYRSLQEACLLIRRGERSCARITGKMKRLICRVNSATIDYVSIVDAGDLTAKKKVEGKVLIAAAVFIGNVRLIDNMIIKLKAES